MSRPPFDVEAIDAMTPVMIERGHRLLQTHRYGDNVAEHVALLLKCMDPPLRGSVLDAGCGLGEVSRLMHGMRRDLRFWLVNASARQLEFCAETLPAHAFFPVLADMHELPIQAGSMDCVMFNSALAQMDEAVALREAHRVLKKGGQLMINELVRTRGDGKEMERVLACRTLTRDELVRAVEAARFIPTSVVFSTYDDSEFREILAHDGLLHLANAARPVIVTARRG